MGAVIGLTNAINMIDGLDGLAAGIVLLAITGLIFFKHDRVNDRVTLCENKLETVGCTKEVRFNDGYVPSINQSGID